ncbi:MAG: hypothetical protein ACLR8Y_15460 [Alistipes indistinctus]
MRQTDLVLAAVDGEAVPEECIEADRTDISKNTPQGEYMYIYRLPKGTINDDKHYIRFRHNKDGEYDENGEIRRRRTLKDRPGWLFRLYGQRVKYRREVFIPGARTRFSRPGWSGKEDEYGDRDVRPRQFGHDQTEIYRRAEVFLSARETDDAVNTGILGASNAPNMAPTAKRRISDWP